jgi:hypothetical protein
MKRIFYVGGIIAVVAGLLSCAGFPEPASEGNSLVIGSLILDFPDGFYDTPSKKFDMNVQLSFRNVTQDARFDVYTNRGYFYFQTNGTDQYVLEDFQLLKITIGNTRYSFSGRPVNMKIATSPNKVIYLGHILFTYTDPGATKRRGRTTYYNYDTSVSVDWDKDVLRQYIIQKQADSRWLALEIVEYNKRQ